MHCNGDLKTKKNSLRFVCACVCVAYDWKQLIFFFSFFFYIPDVHNVVCSFTVQLEFFSFRFYLCQNAQFLYIVPVEMISLFSVLSCNFMKWQWYDRIFDLQTESFSVWFFFALISCSLMNYINTEIYEAIVEFKIVSHQNWFIQVLDMLDLK